MAMGHRQRGDRAQRLQRLYDWGVLYKDYYLLDVHRRRLKYPELKRLVVEHAHRFKANTILIEDKASGTQLIQDLKADGLFGTTAYAPPPGADKIMRLHAQTAMFENGIVRLPRSAPWLHEYVQELISFPGSKYDDQVDSTTQVLDYLRVDDTLEVWRKLGEGSRR
jgi:predicted phage terminase large subunit-like protein